MRIMHVITRGHGGGTEIALSWSICRELEEGHDVLLVTSNSAIGERLKDLCNATFRFIIVPELKTGFSAKKVLASHRLIKKAYEEYKPDLIHTHETVAGVVGRLIKVDQFTLRIHSVHMSIFGTAPSVWFYWLYWPLEYFLSKRTDLYIFVGRGLLQQYNNLRLRAKSGSVFAPSNFDVEKFEIEAPRKSENRAWILEQVGLSRLSDAKIMLSVGILERRKRHQFLLKKISSLLNENSILILIGNGKEKEKIKRFVDQKSLGDFVKLIPYTPQIARYISGASLILHTSTLEGLSQVLIQGNICKTPTISTRNVGTDELTHLYVIPASGHQIKNKVIEVLNNSNHEFNFDYSNWKEKEVKSRYLEALKACEKLSFRKSIEAGK